MSVTFWLPFSAARVAGERDRAEGEGGVDDCADDVADAVQPRLGVGAAGKQRGHHSPSGIHEHPDRQQPEQRGAARRPGDGLDGSGRAGLLIACRRGGVSPTGGFDGYRQGKEPGEQVDDALREPARSAGLHHTGMLGSQAAHRIAGGRDGLMHR